METTIITERAGEMLTWENIDTVVKSFVEDGYTINAVIPILSYDKLFDGYNIDYKLVVSK